MDVKLRKIGNSTGVILPKETLAKHDLAEGDTVTVINTSNGIKLVKASAEFQKQLDAARKGMCQYRNALRELSK